MDKSDAPEEIDCSITGTNNVKSTSDHRVDSPTDSAITKSDGEEHHRLHNVKVFLVLMCLFSIAQGFAINGINNVNIPMFERRFKLTSTQTGLEASFYDIVAGSVVLAVGYFGTRFNQPRLLAGASLALAAGSLTMALPHFITSEYQPSGDNSASAACVAGNQSSSSAVCSDGDTHLSQYLYVLLGGQGLHGLGGIILYVIGPSYIDGSVSSSQSATYLGIFYGSSALGPAIGYMVGGWLLDKYVEFPKYPPEGLIPDSPSWVGAWWIGFLATSAFCVALAFPLFTFPAVLPGTAERRKKNLVDQRHNNRSQSKADRDGFGMTIKDMPIAALVLLKNPAFVCQCLISASEGLLLSGMSTFLPKFVSNQFNQKASFASILTGALAVPSAAAGQLIGGIIVRRFKLKIIGILKFNLLCCAAVILLASTFWVNCEQTDIAGVTIPYIYTNDNASWAEVSDSTEAGEISLVGQCNSQCGCSTADYKPVCINSVEYFSSCHAGCHPYINSMTNETSMHCTCSSQNITKFEEGRCPNSCSMLFVFAPLAFLAFLGTFMMTVPCTTIVFRSVHDKQRTFAISIRQMCMRFLGTIPGPILFGFTLDKACLVWQTKCSETGSCWIYDKDSLGRNFYILMVTLKLVTVVMLIVSYKLYKPPPPSPGEENSQINKTADSDGDGGSDYGSESGVSKL